MIIGFILALFSLSTVIFNVITVIAIVRRKIAPSYLKIKISLILNGIITAMMGFLWLTVGRLNDYDFIWMLIFLLLMVWYALIMATEASKSKHRKNELEKH